MGKGFEDIIDDIKNRDDDDVIGLNRKKKVEKKEGEDQVSDQSDTKPGSDDTHTVFGGYAKESEELVGAGIIGMFGMNFLKGVGEIFKKK